jgi:hypothetical protein
MYPRPTNLCPLRITKTPNPVPKSVYLDPHTLLTYVEQSTPRT